MKIYLVCRDGRNMRYSQLRECYRGLARDHNSEVVLSFCRGHYSLYSEKAKELKKR